MPHLIDAQPVFDAAEKISALIPDPAAQKRFKALLAARLFDDSECARALTDEEAAHFHDDASAPPMAFAPPRAKLLQARRHARLVRDALSERDDLRALKPPLPQHTEATLRFADEWAAKMSRMSYDAVIEKARVIMAERKLRLRAERDEQNLFPPRVVAASSGRVWRRIVSVAELRRAGRDLRNCLAGPSGQRHGYVQRLRDDLTRFWALHDQTRIARAMLAIDSQTGAVKEARGFRNAPYALDGPDFPALVAAGACRAPPPAPPRVLALARRPGAADEGVRRRTAELLGAFVLTRRTEPTGV